MTKGKRNCSSSSSRLGQVHIERTGFESFQPRKINPPLQTSNRRAPTCFRYMFHSLRLPFLFPDCPAPTRSFEDIYPLPQPLAGPFTTMKPCSSIFRLFLADGR